MRLGTKMSAMAVPAALSLLAIKGAVLYILAFSTVGVTETKIARTTIGEEQSQTVAPAKPTTAPAPPTRARPTWVVNCSNSKGGLGCRAVQSVFIKKTGQRFVLAVRVPPDTKKPVILVQVPLGTYLPSGVVLRFGKGPDKSVPIRSCNRSGCLAEYGVAEAEIASMQRGRDLRIWVQTRKREPASLKVPTAGFEAVYAKIK